MTSHNSQKLIIELIRAESQGYCLKGLASEQLVLAIQSVIGTSWWDAQATETLQSISAKLPSPPEDHHSSFPLTQREQEILGLIAAGKNN